MPEISREQAFGKKGFEIAYATFRIAAGQDSAIRSALHAHAIGIMESARTLNKTSFDNHLAGLGSILKIIAESGLIRQNHADLIIAELQNLNSAMNSAILPNSATEPEIGKIFTPLPRQFGNPAIRQREPREQKTVVRSQFMPEIKSEAGSETKEVGDSPKNSPEANVRREAILSKIRQVGDCRLRDIQEALPDISDRTLRYDIQELMASGEVERVGGGGPATHYRVRRNIAAVSMSEEAPGVLGGPLP
ncbi:MAG: DeoR family transcriptional regulator [Candidatus Liptonbacteria bacterium]